MKLNDDDLFFSVLVDFYGKISLTEGTDYVEFVYYFVDCFCKFADSGFLAFKNTRR
jgi:hypothetical protein